MHCPGAGSSRLSTVGLNSYFRSSRQSTASVAPAGPAVRRAMPKQAAHRRGSSLSGSSPDVLGGLIDTVGHPHALLEYPTRSPHSIYTDLQYAHWSHTCMVPFLLVSYPYLQSLRCTGGQDPAEALHAELLALCSSQVLLALCAWVLGSLSSTLSAWRSQGCAPAGGEYPAGLGACRQRGEGSHRPERDAAGAVWGHE